MLSLSIQAIKCWWYSWYSALAIKFKVHYLEPSVIFQKTIQFLEILWGLDKCQTLTLFILSQSLYIYSYTSVNRVCGSRPALTWCVGYLMFFGHYSFISFHCSECWQKTYMTLTRAWLQKWSIWTARGHSYCPTLLVYWQYCNANKRSLIGVILKLYHHLKGWFSKNMIGAYFVQFLAMIMIG